MADFFDKLMKDAKKTAAKVADRTVATANIAKNKTLETVDLVKLEIEIKKVQGDLGSGDTRCWVGSSIRLKRVF